MRSKKYYKKMVSLLLVFGMAIGVFSNIAIADETVRYEQVASLSASDTLPFSDIAGHWGYDAIRFVFERDLMVGTTQTTFAPNAAMTRAQMAQVLYNMEGRPSVDLAPIFSDVVAGRWYSDAVIWAYRNNIVAGVGGGQFAPRCEISREEMVAMLHNYAMFLGKADDLSTVPVDYSNIFSDWSTVSDWAVDAVRWALYDKLIMGYNGRLIPQGNAIRAEMAAMLMQFVGEHERLNAPFVLTISVEETALPQGEPFRVNVELKNNSGEDHEIAYMFLLSPYIPGVPWTSTGRVPLPWPIVELFENGSIISRTIYLNQYYELSQGTYQLSVRAVFFLGWEQPPPILENGHISWEITNSAQQINIVSNTIVLTVR